MNRDVVMWRTRLARGDANGRMDVGVAMREGGLGWILRGLSGDRQAKACTDAMVVHEGTKQTVPKTADVAPRSTVQPKATGAGKVCRWSSISVTNSDDYIRRTFARPTGDKPPCTEPVHA
jgi:hypothetical protein